MGSLESLLAEIDELALARNVAIPHDEARMNYSPGRNTVESFDAFTDLITDYYNYHIGQCVILGGFRSRAEAAGKVKEILEKEYRRQGGKIGAYNDAHDGTNGGLRVVLDKIAEHLKAESVEHHIRDAFDRYVKPNSWEHKVDIMRQFLSRFGHHLSSSIQVNKPERYSHSFEEIIREYVESLKRT